MQDLHRGTITRAYCRAIYEESVLRCFILPPEQGWQGNTIHKEAKRPENRVTRFPVEKSGEARIGGGERSEPISRMFFMPYDTESQSRNADFISIAPKGETTHYILRVASAPSKCVRCAPQSGNPQPSEPFEPFEPSRRRRVHKTYWQKRAGYDMMIK